MLYPLKFKKVFHEKIWGGRALETKLGLNIPEGKKIGEAWIVSAHPNGMSIIENGEFAGETLQEILDKYKAELVGEKIYEKYKNRFPLLIKYLDINDRVSIQVHPDDDYSLKYENELGKSECWYILDSAKNTKVILGMKPEITREKFLEKAYNNDFSNLFAEKSVKKGDFFNIAPGVVHASLYGSVLLVEIQESSDVTYRIYDFDREENGIKRELHIDKAAEVIDYGKRPEITNGELEENSSEKELISSKYYTVKNIKVTEKKKDINKESFMIYTILDGSGSIKSENRKIEVKIGDSVLIPCAVEVEMSGEISFLRISV